MSNPKIVRTLHASIMRFCTDFGELHNLAFVNFDAHADESTMPSQDVIGMMGLSWDVDDEFLEVNVMLGVGTLDDSNLFRLVDKIGELFELVLPSKRISAYDADSGEEIGHFVVRNGTRALPVAGSQSRPVQHIMVGLTSTLTFQL